MINPRGNTTYSPWAVRAAKRKAEEAKKVEGLASITLKPKEGEEKVEDNSPLAKAERFLKAAKSGLMELLTLHGELVKFNQGALVMTIDDLDRKKIQTQFSNTRQKIDELAQKEYEGVKIFSGDFSDAGYKIVLNEAREEFLMIRMEDLSCKGIRIDRLKVDSLVNARKAVQELEDAKRILEQAVTGIISKFQIIEIAKKKADAEKPDSEKKKNEEAEVSPDGGFELKGWKKYFYEDLKKRQREAAAQTGLDSGLLIKLTG